MPPMGIGRGVVNGSSNPCQTNSVTNQPSITDIAAGALLIASVVQGQLSHRTYVQCQACHHFRLYDTSVLLLSLLIMQLLLQNMVLVWEFSVFQFAL